MSSPTPAGSVASDSARLREAAALPLHRRLPVYLRLSGPGWLQSAITLGGGSLSGSLYLGVLGGFGLLWLQPLAMIIGIVMLSAIGYVVVATGRLVPTLLILAFSTWITCNYDRVGRGVKIYETPPAKSG